MLVALGFDLKEAYEIQNAFRKNKLVSTHGNCVEILKPLLFCFNYSFGKENIAIIFLRDITGIKVTRQRKKCFRYESPTPGYNNVNKILTFSEQ